MAKTKISEFSSTPGNNTDIDSINIAEGCAPSGINNAIRELMAQLKDFQAGTAGDSFNGPVGTSTAAAGAFTTLSASSTVSGTGFSNYLASPPAIGGTAAAAGSFTTLTTSSTVTHNGGTANGVAYLNGSKVLTTGSALTFDGTTLTSTGGSLYLNGTNSDTAMAGSYVRFGTNLGTQSNAANTALVTKAFNGSVFYDAYSIGNNNTWIWNYSGSEAMRLTSTGLGIGTSSPAYKLDVVGTAQIGGVTPTLLVNDGTINYRIINTAGAAYTGTISNHPLVFQTNNGERMRLDSSGNLGLGVTPSAWASGFKAFQVAANTAVWGGTGTTGPSYFSNNVIFDGARKYINTAAASEYQQNSGSHLWLTAPSGTAGNAISFTQAMTLDASGNLLVGTTSLISGSERFALSSSASDWTQYTRNTNATPYGLRITYSAAAPNGTGSEFLYCSDNGPTVRATIRSNGGLANFSGNNVNLSDRREKTNFAPAKSYLDAICAIPVQTFNYIDQNMEEDPGLTLGVVAQDVQAVAPELVMESNWAAKDEEPKMRLSVYQTDLQYALMKCIQEQQAIITALTARVAALESN